MFKCSPNELVANPLWRRFHLHICHLTICTICSISTSCTTCSWYEFKMSWWILSQTYVGHGCSHCGGAFQDTNRGAGCRRPGFVSLLGLVHGVTRDNRVFCGAAMLVAGDLAAKDTMRATRHQVTPVFVLESGPPPPPPPPRRHLQLLFWGHHVTLEWPYQTWHVPSLLRRKVLNIKLQS